MAFYPPLYPPIPCKAIGLKLARSQERCICAVVHKGDRFREEYQPDNQRAVRKPFPFPAAKKSSD